MTGYPSWGRYPAARQRVRALAWAGDELPLPQNGGSVLPRGLGRSYGDSCLNDGGWLLDTTRLDHLIELDAERGLLRCEAGVSLAAILEIALPRGWFLPVTPGTKHVTIGGAVANDVHGKNHHRAGTFGRFVTRFELLRSDCGRIVCTPEQNASLFQATIGGLGLTGLITWVELRLKPVVGGFIDVESVRFDGLDAFFDLAVDSDARFEYTVAWVDCAARGPRLGRGLLLRGNHAPLAERAPARPPRLAVPFDLPGSGFLLNRLTLRAFNAAYYGRQRREIVRRRVSFDPFFYPLDGVRDWNRLYGTRGFLQYQCLVPPTEGRAVMRSIFGRVAEAGEGSFLAVLKLFGELPSPGLLSFPRPGVTLALDFAIRGPETFALLDQLDALVASAGGRVYPAKDARMSARSFRQYFPEWEELRTFVDPAFSSSFWRRVTAEAGPDEGCPSAS